MPHQNSWSNGKTQAFTDKSKSSFKSSKIHDVPPGEAFIQHAAKLLTSRSWRSLSLYARQALDRLEIEHCAHAGKENGYLIVTFDDFQKWGIPRKWIKPAITELVNVNLVIIERHGLARNGNGIPSLYRLTYLKYKLMPIVGSPYYLEPTNEWRVFEDPRIPIPDKPKPKNNNLSMSSRSKKSFISVPASGTESVPSSGTEREPSKPETADPLGTCVGNYYLHYGLPNGRWR